MIFCTSIAPKHINLNAQKIATDSWLDLGIPVYSFNSPEEIELLKSQYPKVEFVPTLRTMELTYGKQYVSVNAILDWCKEKRVENVCIINSDIEMRIDLKTLAKIENEMSNQILMSQRVNYGSNKQGVFRSGIDTFFINEKFLSIYPQSVYAIGQCHWDYWIPYKAILSGINTSFIRNEITFHKEHKEQYDHNSWLKTGRYFQWENNLFQFSTTKGIGEMSTYVHTYIMNASKTITI